MPRLRRLVLGGLESFRVVPDWRQNKSRSGHKDKPQRLFDVTSAIPSTFASPEWSMTFQKEHPAYF
jgi:hypothetical protein